MSDNKFAGATQIIRAAGARPVSALFLLLCFFTPTPAQPPAVLATRPAATRPAASQPNQPRIVQFQPGIRINWIKRQVEVDATVILREGLIELFACSPKNREHEAIIRIEARPMHLYQAIGLIGLTPGRPSRFDPQTEKSTPATGDPVDLEVRYSSGAGPRQEPIEAWMKPTDGKTLLGRLPWVFAGSVPLEQREGIATDVEGTVVALVDFSSSLIALPETHSDRNDELWLRPNTERIPVVGAKCELIIRAAPLRLRLEPNGRLQLFQKTVTRAELARAVSDALRDNPDLRVEVTVQDGAEPLEEKGLIQLLQSLHVREQSIVIVSPSSEKRSGIR